jgi:hypothetical protein
MNCDLIAFSDELRLGPGEDLFNFLADCVLDFVRSEGMEKEELSLGTLVTG